ncbi:MAG: AraC family transcriptional regulator ligand-binding domain-containing protein [Rhodobacteraceae bacterium]|nr:AraC family transcriptional regulator ligand-binding domain-containing protein [Paracoccaceae bacterium]
MPEMVEQRASYSALLDVFCAESLPLEILENRETRLPVRAMMGAFEKAARATGERVFGLDVGQSMSHGAFGLWTEYCTAGEILGEALLRSVRSWHFHQTGGVNALEREGPYAIWRYYPPQCGETNIQHSDRLCCINRMRGFML